MYVFIIPDQSFCPQHVLAHSYVFHHLPAMQACCYDSCNYRQPVPSPANHCLLVDRTWLNSHSPPESASRYSTGCITIPTDWLKICLRHADVAFLLSWGLLVLCWRFEYCLGISVETLKACPEGFMQSLQQNLHRDMCIKTLLLYPVMTHAAVKWQG